MCCGSGDLHTGFIPFILASGEAETNNLELAGNICLFQTAGEDVSPFVMDDRDRSRGRSRSNIGEAPVARHVSLVLVLKWQVQNLEPLMRHVTVAANVATMPASRTESMRVVLELSMSRHAPQGDGGLDGKENHVDKAFGIHRP